jgi:alkaline phosphatase D
MGEREVSPGWSRRTFLQTGGAGLLASALPRAGAGGSTLQSTAGGPSADGLPRGITRTWIGRSFWANRLQDWRLHNGRIECLDGRLRVGMRSVALLTAEMVAGDLDCSLNVRTGSLSAGKGFSGFLIGAGAGMLDYRAAALVQRASGTGGGLLCTYESGGAVRFRDHTDEKDQLAYAALPVVSANGGPRRHLLEDVELSLQVVSLGSGRFRLRLAAVDHSTGALLASAVSTEIDGTLVRGGISLVSAPRGDSGGARYWFRSLQTSGAKIVKRPGRALGPIVGTLYSSNRSTLKMTAQFTPIGREEPQHATLQLRAPGRTAWRTLQTVSLGAGYTALFRVTDWDSTRRWEYRVLYAPGTRFEDSYTGVVPQDPISQPQLAIGMLNCTIHAHRRLDMPGGDVPRIPGEHHLGLYTDRNLYFPYATLKRNLARQRLDMLVVLGDQFYEHRPTTQTKDDSPLLDSLYKFFHWMWSFRGITRDIPTIVLVDDHDLYQGNLWGHGGAPANDGYNSGGYVKSTSWINAMQRIQCGHNPDPFDPTPVLQGITVYYGSFRYGAVSFAIMEDRKFKTGDKDGLDASGNPYPAETSTLLGERQHSFLSAWTGQHPGLPKVCLTQTMYASLQTTSDGAPEAEFDSNGYPAVGRRRALRLLKASKALMLSGDQHLASLVRHGIDTFTDGPVQFGAPAAGSAYQRWFQPADPLSNPGPTEFTGDFTDAFGNKLRVLAVANPKVSFEYYRRFYPDPQQSLGDRTLKREGYGVVRVDKTERRFVIECWPWEVDPDGSTAEQFRGWPHTFSFDSV